nr:MAG: AAA domain-containing protein [Candidatus Methanoperedens sp.]
MEIAKAFEIALEGEKRYIESTKVRYIINNLIRSVSNDKFILQGICSGSIPKKGSMVSPLNDECRLKVEDVTGSTVILSSFSPIIVTDNIFVDTLYDANFSKMTSALRELGVSESIHSRVLFGNAPLPVPSDIEELRLYKQELNTYQEDAVISGLANKLALVQGPPGTGKTVVSAELALQHVLRGRRVLLVAKTNKAADRMMIALVNHLKTTNAPKELLQNILRFGIEEKISPEIGEYTLQQRIKKHSRYSELEKLEEEKDICFQKLDVAHNSIQETEEFIHSKPMLGLLRIPIAHIQKNRLITTVSEIEKKIIDLNARTYTLAREISTEVIGSSKVVVSTAYQCPRSELYGILFDAIIFDESSQATVPEAAMAIVKLKHDGYLTIIGDHMQLGPIVMSAHTMLSVSLYDLLLKRINDHMPTQNGTQSMVTLRKQYRMHPDIADICAALAYPEGLESAEIDTRLEIDTSKLNGCWQDKVIDPALPVVFVSTEKVTTYEKKDSKKSTYNVKEAEIIVNIVERLEEIGIRPNQVSIISAYKGQTELLSQMLKNYSVGTVDSFQGSEQEIVIFDLTRDNANKEVGFLNQINRLNVAVSRARKKLIIVGNQDSLSNVNDPIFRRFLFEVIKNVIVVPEK